MNAYETGARKAVPAVLVYPRCGRSVLMLHRNARPEDFHAGKWNGLGGKCEPDESPLQAARRELKEESGLDLPARAFKPLGALQFPNFKPSKREDWIVFVFSTKVPPRLKKIDFRCPEGDLHWLKSGSILSLNLWPGDRFFLPHVLAGRPFIGSIWYEEGRVARHWIQKLD